MKPVQSCTGFIFCTVHAVYSSNFKDNDVHQTNYGTLCAFVIRCCLVFYLKVVALVKRRWHRQRQRSSTYTNPSTQRSSIYTQSRKTDYAMEGTTLLDDTKKDSNENHKRDIGSTGYDDQNMSNSTI